MIKTRNSSIDLLKLYFSVIVVLLHIGQSQLPGLFPLGYMVVEGFFMITGYFMMNAVSKSQNSDIGKDTLKFITHKFSSFFLPLLFSSIIAFATLIITDNYTMQDLVFRSMYLLSEIIPLQITGLKSFAPTGVAWYLSSMMISLFILYPVAKKAGSRFTRIICPLLVMLIYGSLCMKYTHLDTIVDLFYDLPVYTGLLRGIAGICTGCIIFECVKATEHHKASLFGKICFTVIEILSFSIITFYMFFFPKSETNFFILPLFFVLLYCLFGRKSLLSENISFGFSKHLGTASLLIYLNHNYWNYFIGKTMKGYSLATKFGAYFLMIFCSCLIVQGATMLTRFLWKKAKPFLKKHFVNNEPD